MCRHDQGALTGEMKRPYICALQYAMHGCLQKATAVRPNTIFFLLHCGAKPQNYGLVLTCFSLSCNLGPISLSRVSFIMESEKHTCFVSVAKAPWAQLCNADVCITSALCLTLVTVWSVQHEWVTSYLHLYNASRSPLSTIIYHYCKSFRK